MPGARYHCAANRLTTADWRAGEWMSKDEIAQKVQAIIAENLGVNRTEVVPSASFVNDLNADSLDIVELVMEIEKEFDLEIPDDEAEKIRTVKDAIDYIVATL
jgi:acyl carrier protein